MSTNDMFKKLNLMKFNEIFEYFMIKFIHSCIYGANFNIFEEHFAELLPDHKYETRDKKINFPVVRLQSERVMTKYHFILLFNTISY